jgi:hypothetical protein
MTILYLKYKKKKKQKNMENFKLSFTDNTTFYGKDLEGFFATALLTGDSKSEFKLIPNIKSKAKLGQLNIGNILQAADCTFSNTGEGTLAQKSVEVEPVKINLSYCKRTFETDYLSNILRPGSNTGEVMPASVESFLLEQVALKVSADLEQVAWKGDTGTASYPLSIADGLEKLFLADAAVLDVSATASAITKANVVAELTRVYDTIPEQLIGAEDMRIFVSSSIYRSYRQALADSSLEVNFMQNYGELHFLDVKIVKANGLSTKKMVAARTSNLLLLTDLVSDFEAISILPQSNVTGEPTVRLVGEFKIGFNYIYGSEVVYYN